MKIFFYLEHNQIEVYGQFWQELSIEKFSNFGQTHQLTRLKKMQFLAYMRSINL